jgi:glucose/arabinose dehydrogenase
MTLFTAPAGYDLATTGSTTIAPGGIEVYTATAIPGWSPSILVTGMRTGAVYRLKLSNDGKSVDGRAIEYFKANDRYRDLALSPDGRRIYAVTDGVGTALDGEGRRAEALAHPAALLEFTYSGK